MANRDVIAPDANMSVSRCHERLVRPSRKAASCVSTAAAASSLTDEVLTLCLSSFVPVEAAAGLAAEVAFANLGQQQIARLVTRVAGAVVQHPQAVHDVVEADQIRGGQRPGGVAEASLEQHVDCLGGGQPLLHNTR